MEISTTFNLGDKGWVFADNMVQQYTIGQVRLEITDSPGIAGESMFSNYAPQKGRVEQYMCIESGIGSGALYTIGEHIFTTQQECAAAHAVHLAKLEKERIERESRRHAAEEAEEQELRARLARIESRKSKSVSA